MAITTDSYIDVLDNESHVVDRIGLSKALSNYTVEDLMAFAYCSNTDKLFRDIRHGLPAGSTVTGVGFTNVTGGIPCIWSRVTNPSYWILRTEQGTAGNQNNMQGMYKVVVWLYGEDPTASNTLDYNNPYYTDLADLKLVTKWDAPHYLFDVHNIGMYNTGDFGATSWGNPKSAEAWEISGNTYTLDYHTDLKSESDEAYSIPTEAGKVIKPYNLFLFDGNIYIKPIIPIAGSRSVYGMASTYFTTFNASSTSECSCVMRDATGNNPIGVNNAIASLYKNTAMSTAITFPYDVRVDNNGTDYGIDANGYKIIYYRQGNSSPSRSVRITYLYDKEDDLKLFVAGAGLHFKADKVYKPIINGGHVDGFSDVLTDPSELDNWHDKTDHGITPTPPGPTPPSGDDIDDHIMGAGSQLSGIAQLWLLTRAQLIDLHAAFANAPVNYDPMSSFISVMGLGISALRVVGDSMPWTLNPINIRMSNGETWHTGVEGHIVDTQASAFNEVNIHVQRKYNNFLDYSPYATHEIFLPMCGWITLPDIAVNREITVTYIPDIETLKVRAVVSVVDNSGHRCVIGEKDGVMGAEIPFTNIGHSLFLGNTVVQSADIAGEIVTGAIGAGFTKTNAQGGKFRPYEGFTVGMAGTLPGAIGNALVSGNINRTHFTTGNGSRIGFGDGENIQIKSTYHRIDKPNNYDHTVGKVCNKTGQLSNFTGFTVCDNPHINFSATEREKEEIKQLLEQGVIL